MGMRGQQDSARLSSQPLGQTRGEASILLEAKSAPPPFIFLSVHRGLSLGRTPCISLQ